MVTNNYGIDLMLPFQANKDVLFNEAIVKFDSFCNFAITSFIDKIPSKLTVGSMHIITDGEYKMSICYCPSEACGWKIQAAKKGMVFFVQSENRFFHFEGIKWDAITMSTAGAGPAIAGGGAELIPPKTFGASGSFDISGGITKLWIYMSGDSVIDLTSATVNSLTLIIKQNYQKICKLEFRGNIMWKDKRPFQLTQKPNSFDVIRFHKISETNHWIPEIVGQGFEY